MFNPNDYQWDQTFQKIQTIKERVGHADIPSNKGYMTDKNKVNAEFMGWAED
jgi:hypothetical protein